MFNYKNCKIISRKRTLYVIVYTIIFLLTAFLTFSPFLIKGTSFICFQGDGGVQHYPILMYMGQWYRRIIKNVLSGKIRIPLFDITMGGVGDDVIGYAHSLGGYEPLMLFSTLVPTRYTEYLYGFLVIFRLYLAGLSFSYLCNYYKKDKRYTLIGSMIYCFSGYSITTATSQVYFVWPMMIFPLMIVGAEKVLRKERPFLLSMSVFYSALCGYYHLYMMIIMIALFAIIRFFDIYNKRRIKEFISAFARGIGSCLLGLGLSAPIFLPGIVEFLNSVRSGFTSSHGPTAYNWDFYRTSFFRIIAPPVAEADLSLAALVLFALILLICSKRKRTMKILVVIAFVVYLTSIGGMIMNGFQYPCKRWAFGITLLLAFVAVEMMPELFNLTRRQQILCICTSCAYTVLAFLTEDTRRTAHILVGVVAVTVTSLVLLTHLNSGGVGEVKNKKLHIFNNINSMHVRPLICLIVVIFNVGIIGIYYVAADQGNWISRFVETGYETEWVESKVERDLRPYLLNKPEGRGDSSSLSLNMAMIWQIPGTIGYSSVLNQYFSDYSQQIENCGSSLAFKISSSDQRTISNALLSTKYQIEEERNSAKVPYGYILLKKLENGRQIYQNEYALPWGYTYDHVISYEELNGLNGIQKQEAMIQAIAIGGMGDKQTTYSPQFDEYEIPYQVQCNGCQWEDEKLTVLEENAEINLSFSMPSDVEGYVRLIGFDMTGNGSYFTFQVKCGDVLKEAQANSATYPYYFGRENYLFNLGYGQKARNNLTITFPSKGTFKLKGIELFALPMDNYPGYVEKLRSESLENISISTNQISGTVDLSKDKILCMSIPYSKGWTAKVDGNKTEIMLGNYMFMAIPLTKGQHTIEFSYCSPGLKIGMIISLCSVVVLISIFIFKNKKTIEREK